MKLTLGLSPCPNDTFIFDALINQKIDTEGLEFAPKFADIEQLNLLAFKGDLDVTKFSFSAFTDCFQNYLLLDSGSALGRACGPLLVKKPSTIINDNSEIAIPGNYTTANLLLKLFYPSYSRKKEVLFSDIENEILNEKVDAGVIIHENRFTFLEKGLEKVSDLGELWESSTGTPIPLGGIGIKREMPAYIQKKVEQLLRKSVLYAFNNRNASLDFIKKYSQELNEDVINQHIDLYVNEYTISLSESGKNAIKLLFKKVGVKSQHIFFDSSFVT